MVLSIAHPSASARRRFAAAWVCVFLATLVALLAGAARADSAAPPRDPDKLYIDADEILYDKDHNIVTAQGGVVMYYKNRVLQADKVVYDRLAKRVKADGRVKLTDEHHNISYAPRFDLTEDFAAGFADSVQEFGADKTRTTSPRIERTAGGITVLETSVYTACEPCKAHPDWPAQWQVRAAKIIENSETHTVYFEQAWIDVLGVPIAYFPYISAPDSSVTRQTGVLSPIYGVSSRLGYSIGAPYFMALAPNYDLTLTPIYFTNQGPALDAVWRQRLDNGKFQIQLSGVEQAQPGRFPAAPYGAGDLKYRGSAQTDGQIYLNAKWTLGWDLNWFSDRFYRTDYKLATVDASHLFDGEIVSSLYLRGKDARAYFDLSGYGFQPTTAYLATGQDPVAAPVMDYHRTFDLPANPGYGGEVGFDFSAANINRAEALYQSVGKQQFDPTYNLYSVCTTYTPGTTSSNCLLRGVAGDYSRATGQVSWQTKYVDPVGEVWSPFVFARVSGAAVDLNTSASDTYPGGWPANNNLQPAFFNGASSGASANAMPGVGLEYRYPFVSNSPLGQQVIEPIAQLIVRPNEVMPKLDINADAQSLVFDTTNLFSWSKYSGYDRVEGGTRLNYGLQYTDNFSNGGHANFVAGQSIQLAGQNSYTIADAANTGLDSGLDKRYSDFIASETLQPWSAPVSFTSKQQLDPTTFAFQRFDAIASAVVLPSWIVNVDWARYAAQPAIGWPYPREGLTANASYHVDRGLSVIGGVVFDMSRQYYDVPGENTPRFYATGFNLGVRYETECTTFKATYTSVLSDPLSYVTGVQPIAVRDQTLMFQLTLRTLGDVVRGSFGTSTVITNN